MTPSLLLYDIETTGLNKCFDQVVQFAAIRTDLNLNELSRHEIRIKLNSDVTPSPEAIKTHGITLKEMQQGELEIDGIIKIHKLLNTPGTISLGYNTLGFDDEFLRFSFYRNLLAPYNHQFKNQCGRMDIYPMTILYYLFKHDTLQWPMIDDKVSLKLEHLNQSNQLAKGTAHDAMVDVEATLALAKILHKDRKMWDYLCGYFNKKTDIERGNSLPISFESDDRIFRDGLIVNGKLGKANQFIAPVLSLGEHYHYKNQTLWLRLDNENLLKANKDNIPDTTRTIRKKMAEQQILLPPEQRYYKPISTDRQQLANENRERLLKDTKLLSAICEYHLDYKYPVVANVDIDAALYTMPFPKPFEEKLFQDFHKATPDKKLAIAERFPNKKRYEQAIRIIARHYPDVLPAKEKTMFDDYLESPAIDFRGEQKFTDN